MSNRSFACITAAFCILMGITCFCIGSLWQYSERYSDMVGENRRLQNDLDFISADRK